MKITLEFEKNWPVNIAGDTFVIEADRIPKETWIAIVRDRLLNKGRDTWADSSKVTGDVTRQTLWTEALESVYSGAWVPGVSARGPRKKNMDYDTFAESQARNYAKSKIKKGCKYSTSDGNTFTDSDADIAAFMKWLLANAEYRKIIDGEWQTNLNKNNLKL
jgi:hypothetical protein